MQPADLTLFSNLLLARFSICPSSSLRDTESLCFLFYLLWLLWFFLKLVGEGFFGEWFNRRVNGEPLDLDLDLDCEAFFSYLLLLFVLPLPFLALLLLFW